MIFMGRPQELQRPGSSPHVRAMSLAQERRRPCRNSESCSPWANGGLEEGGETGGLAVLRAGGSAGSTFAGRPSAIGTISGGRLWTGGQVTQPSLRRNVAQIAP